MSDCKEDDQPTPPVEYIVEKILNSRRKNGKLEYFIKWKNYPDSDNSWEPEQNCQQCVDLIDEFNSQKSARRGSSITSRGKKKRSSAVREDDTSSLSSSGNAKKSRLLAYIDTDEEDTPSASATPCTVSVAPADEPSASAAVVAAESVMNIEDHLPKIDEEENPEEENRAPSLSSVVDENGRDRPVAIPPDSSYLISRGDEVEEVIGISNVYKHELMAVVKYKSKEMEAVPTRLIMDMCAKPLAMFYESKLKFTH